MSSRSRSNLVALLALASLAACSGAAAPPPALGAAAGREVATVATFEGRYDPGTGALTIQTTPTAAAVGRLGRSAYQPFQDGVPNGGPVDTFELVTEASPTPGVTVDGCGPGVDSFDGRITLRSFFKLLAFTDVAIELTSVTSGHEACLDTAAYGGMSSAFGLWDYGPIGLEGSASALWSFAFTTSEAFTFRGRIMAQASPLAAPPYGNAATSFEWAPWMFADPPHSFQDVATTLSHVTWNGSAFVDSKGVASFTRVGGVLTSTTVGIASPVQAYTGPWPAGGAGRYEAPPSTLAADTSGDFTVCVKFKPGVNPGPMERKVLVALGNPIGQPDQSFLAGDFGWALTQQRGPLVGGGPQFGFFYRTGNETSATDSFVFPGANPENSAFDYSCGGRASLDCVYSGTPGPGPCIRVLAHGRDGRFDYPVSGTFATNVDPSTLPLAIGAAAGGLWPAIDEGVYEVIIDSRPASAAVMSDIIDRAEGRRLYNGASSLGNDVDALPALGVDGISYGFPFGSTAPASTDASGLMTEGRVLRFSKVLTTSPGAYCVGAEVTSPNWAAAYGGILGDNDGILRLFIGADHVATGFSGGSPATGPNLGTAGWAANSRHVFKVCATTGSPVALWVDGVATAGWAAGSLFDLTSASELHVGQGRVDAFGLGLVPLTGARIGRVFACPTAVAADCN